MSNKNILRTVQKNYYTSHRMHMTLYVFLAQTQFCIPVISPFLFQHLRFSLSENDIHESINVFRVNLCIVIDVGIAVCIYGTIHENPVHIDHIAHVENAIVVNIAPIVHLCRSNFGSYITPSLFSSGVSRFCLLI